MRPSYKLVLLAIYLNCACKFTEKSEIENLRAFWKLGQGNCKVRECSDFKIVSFILDLLFLLLKTRNEVSH